MWTCHQRTIGQLCTQGSLKIIIRLRLRLSILLSGDHYSPMNSFWSFLVDQVFVNNIKTGSEPFSNYENITLKINSIFEKKPVNYQSNYDGKSFSSSSTMIKNRIMRRCTYFQALLFFGVLQYMRHLPSF